ASQLRRIRCDTIVGMAISNVVAFFIMLTAIAALRTQGVSEIHTAADAAQALRPLAGDFAFVLFAVGILGTGLLAGPVLAGSAAYAVAEAFKWRVGLGRTLTHAKGFYIILAAATLLGIALNFTSVDPMQALFWSAVVNGVIAVPIMVVMLLLAAKPAVM